MIIHDAFAPYRVIQGDGPQEAGQKAMAFKQLVDTLYNKLGSSWSFVMWMSFQGMPHARPDSLEAVWHSWGIDTVEQLSAFVSGFDKINVKAIIDDISPFITIDLKQRQKITGVELKKLVMDNCNTETNIKFHYTDASYYLLSNDDLDNLLHYSRLPQMQYIPEKRDCDDYARMFKSWLSYMAYGNMSVGYVEMNMYMDGNIHGAHAVNLVVTEDKKVQLLEPQKSFVWNPKEPETNWPHLTDQKLYLVEF